MTFHCMICLCMTFHYMTCLGMTVRCAIIPRSACILSHSHLYLHLYPRLFLQWHRHRSLQFVIWPRKINHRLYTLSVVLRVRCTRLAAFPIIIFSPVPIHYRIRRPLNIALVFAVNTQCFRSSHRITHHLKQEVDLSTFFRGLLGYIRYYLHLSSVLPNASTSVRDVGTKS